MVQVAERTLKEVDAIMWLVEPSTFVGAGERHIAEQLQKVGVPVILIINKIDTVKKKSFFLRSIPTVRSVILQRSFLALPSAEKTHRISFQVFSNIFRTDRCSMMKIQLPTSLSARSPQRIIREKALHALDEEIPHGIAVAIDRMKKRPGRSNIIDIDATIICERNSHKGIIIGKQGAMLKKIGSNARYELERMLEAKVNLKLWVKVTKNWRDSDFLIKNFGYDKKEI